MLKLKMNPDGITIELPYKFTPRDYQLPFLKAAELKGIKRSMLVYHRRSGKDKLCLNYMVAEAWLRVGLYAYFFPTYKQGRKVLWNGIDKDGFRFINHIPEEIRENTNDTDMRIWLINGSIIQVFGTDDFDAFMGTNPIGCVFSEYALQVPNAWDYIRPILKENGGWVVFQSTPRGRNHAFKLAEMAKRNKRWFYQELTVLDTFLPDGTRVITDEMIQEERDEGMSEALIQQEYFCSWDSALDACFFGNSLQRHDKTCDGVRGDLVVDGNDKVQFVKNDRGILEVWEHPYNRKPGWDKLKWEKRYCIGSDISEGLERDFSVAYVYDRVTQEFISRMRSNKVDAYLWADFLHRLSLYYDRALIIPERNGVGITTCDRLVNLKANYYFNSMTAMAGSPMTRIVGWVETRESKNKICGDLREYFTKTTGRVMDSLLLTECSTFVIKENEKIEAEDGFHDDGTIAAALALQGSPLLFDGISQTGHEELEEKKQEELMDSLDSTSRAAMKDYNEVIGRLKDENEYSTDWF